MNNSEPVSLTGAVTLVLQTGVTLAALLYPGITKELQIGIIAFGNALILVAAVYFARSKVTSIAAPTLVEGTPVTVLTPSGEANRVETVGTGTAVAGAVPNN